MSLITKFSHLNRFESNEGKISFEIGKFLMKIDSDFYGIVPLLFIREGIHAGLDFSGRATSSTLCVGKELNVLTEDFIGTDSLSKFLVARTVQTLGANCFKKSFFTKI